MNKKIKNPKLVSILILILIVGIVLEFFSSFILNLADKIYDKRYYGYTTVMGFFLYLFIEIYGISLLIYLLVKKYQFRIWIFPFLNSLTFVIPFFRFLPNRYYPNLIYNSIKLLGVFIGIMILLKIKLKVK